MADVAPAPLCPCQSGEAYENCCGPFVREEKIPSTPLTLMRSRYTAYTAGNIDYIAKTMQGPALKNFNPVEAKQWATSVVWQGLTVVEHEQINDSLGFVEFRAVYHANDNPHTLHERSRFEKSNGRWFYVDGELPAANTKTGRNDPCPCGSGKKYKRCCIGQ